MNRQREKDRKVREAIDAPDGLFVSRHREFIEAARRSHAHTVTYREAVDESTCVTYTLKLFCDPTYRAIAGNYRQVFAGRDFMEWLLSSNHLQEIATPMPGCMILYFAGSAWQHIGAMPDGKRVVSKWGLFPVYEHDVLEVPARYGDEVRYFRPIANSEALELFLKFAKSCGLSDDDIADVSGSA